MEADEPVTVYTVNCSATIILSLEQQLAPISAALNSMTFLAVGRRFWRGFFRISARICHGIFVGNAGWAGAQIRPPDGLKC
jgi:hypothetical protein